MASIAQRFLVPPDIPINIDEEVAWLHGALTNDDEVMPLCVVLKIDHLNEGFIGGQMKLQPCVLSAYQLDVVTPDT